jgi:hypothetical protein
MYVTPALTSARSHCYTTRGQPLTSFCFEAGGRFGGWSHADLLDKRVTPLSVTRLLVILRFVQISSRNFAVTCHAIHLFSCNSARKIRKDEVIKITDHEEFTAQYNHFLTGFCTKSRRKGLIWCTDRQTNKSTNRQTGTHAGIPT